MKSLSSLLRIVTMVLVVTMPLANADDFDLPSPQDGQEEEVPFNPPPQEEAPEDFSLGGEEGSALPPPAGSEGKGENVVNAQQESDEVFLPTPEQSSDSANYAPLPTQGGSSRVNYEEGGDWRYGWNRRPIFSAHGGVGVFNYPVQGIEENISGPMVGASIRVWDIGQTVFLHAYGSMSWVKLGGVGPFTQVKDAVFHIGPMVEIGIGRRLSLYGSLLRRNHTLKASNDASGDFGSINNFATIANEGWKLGVGAQYDFYVIPHGSFGIRGHVEQDMALVALTMSIEPAPRKRLSLNFKDEP